MRTLKDFVQMDWEPVVLPTLKYATQRHYKYMLGVHLIPIFGERRLPDISREAIQTFLAAKLRDGFAWETVHHIRCALSKVLGTAEEWDYISDNPVRKTRLPRTGTQIGTVHPDSGANQTSTRCSSRAIQIRGHVAGSDGTSDW